MLSLEEYLRRYLNDPTEPIVTPTLVAVNDPQLVDANDNYYRRYLNDPETT